MTTLAYQPDGAVLSAFLKDNSFVRVITGPFGSGKSVVCCIEIFRRSCEQRPGPDKVRRSRWMVVRNTYPMLKRSTVPTWSSWFPESFGAFTWGPPPSQRILQPLADGTALDLEVQFTALDDLRAEADLKGFEGSGIWFNELAEIPRSVVQFGLGRIGRFPSAKDGGPSWYGIIGDSNPPDTDHWLYQAAEEERPKGWAFFRQPGGVIKVGQQWVPNPEAENVRNLPRDYYTQQMTGQGEDFIRVYLGGEYGYVTLGKVVFPEFSDAMHVSSQPLEPVAGLPLIIGVDFGLTPAAVICQRTASGRWFAIDELVSEDMGVVRFAELLRGRLAAGYSGFAAQAWGDPAGAARSQTDEKSCIEMLAQHTGIPVRPAPTNEWTTRREAVAHALNRLIDGRPGFVLSPVCKTLRRGFSGQYHFKRVRTADGERFHDKPDKNQFSHVHDGLQYALSGGGEGTALIRGHGVNPYFVPDRDGRLPRIKYPPTGVR